MGIVFIVGVVIFATMVLSFSSKRILAPTLSQQGRGKISVVASFYPLSEFARQVAGERAEVVNLVPAGVEPHDFEPSPKDIVTVYGAKLLILNGAGIDAWVNGIRSDMEVRGVRVLDMARVINTFTPDPHFWLDPVFAAREVEAIRDTLMEVDSAGAEEYRARAGKYLAELMALDRAYRDGLASCAQKEIVTSHAAFGYLAKRYNMAMVPIAGLSPEEEPSPKKLAEIVRTIRKRGIRFIFMETLVNPKLAQTIASETGAGILIFNPLEGLTDAEAAAGENYISIMRKNLENLRRGLLCR